MLVAAVGHVDEILGSGLGPTNRTSGAEGQGRHHGELGVRDRLRAEPATDRLGPDPDGAGVDAEYRCDRPLDPERALGRAPHDDPVAVGFGQCHARLHRAAGDPLVDELAPHDHVVPGQPFRVGVGPVLEHEVRRGAREQHGGVVGERGTGFGDHGQIPVVDDHRLGGVDGCFAGLGHDGHHRLTDEPHDIARQRWAVEHLWYEEEAPQRVEAEIGGGHHLHDPRMVACAVHVDVGDLGVGDQ